LKPCGISTAEVDDLARLAERAVFAAVGFVMRLGPMLETIREVAAGAAVQYASFKFVAGTVQRYSR
jgi:predicted dehydrogenase